MGKIGRCFRKIKDDYDLLTAKKYTTLAGTLVFFLITSLLPMLFWITLLFGKIPAGGERLTTLLPLDGLKEVFAYIQSEAASATDGASLLLLLTTLYSATNLFYQMRRTGELVYDYRQQRRGLKVRLGAVLLLFLTMLLSLLIVLFFTFLSFVFSLFLSKEAGLIADYLLLALAAFVLVLFFNVYVCPYKMPISTFLRGSFFTVGAWMVAVLAFSLYLRYSSFTRLYGALSAVVVFLLWLYWLMIGFVVGVVLNSKRVIGRARLYNP